MRGRCWLAMVVVVVVAAAMHAQAPAGAPAGATGICKDGTYSQAARKEGACRGHKGVQTWYAAAMPAKAPAAMPAPAPAAAVPAKPVPTPMPAAPARPAPAPAVVPPPAAPAPGKRLSPAQAAAAKPQASGGGPGLVWVNMDSKVYHCNGDTFYGKTKNGKYMSEADARAMGARGERGKVCTGK